MNKRHSNVDVYEQKVYLSINAFALLDIEAPQMKCDAMLRLLKRK
jgi:hypothetical protein